MGTTSFGEPGFGDDPSMLSLMYLCQPIMWFFVGDGVVNLAVNLAWVVRRAWFLPLRHCVISSAIDNVKK